MKNLLALLMLWAVSIEHSTACDVCGCAGGSAYMGILPEFHRHFVGTRWYYRQFESTHRNGNNVSKTQEVFNTFDLWGRFYPHKRIQLFAFVPYNLYFQHQSDGNTVRVNGLGDVSLIANFVLIPAKTGKLWTQTLLVGGGVKLPTGQRVAGIEDNMQPTTGSTDAILNANYTLRRKTLGMNVEVNGRLNSVNARHYQFGNRLNVAARVFVWKQLSKTLTILPQAGVALEMAAKDKHYNVAQDQSGGNVLLTTLGTEVYLGKHLALNVNWQQPIVQNLTSGDIKAQSRLQTTLTVLF